MNRARWTSVACIAGISARLACALAGPGAVRTDAIGYRDLARSLAQGHGYASAAGPAAHWMPGWPAWMSLFYRAGLGDRAIVFASALLGIATIFLAARVARDLGRDPWVAAALCALAPSLATMPRVLASENLAVPVFALATWLLVRASSRGRVLDWLAFALATSLAIWIREACLALVLAGLAVAVTRGAVAARVRSCAVIVVVVALALAPWIARNRAALGSTTLTTSDAATLCVGLGEGATGGFRSVSQDAGFDCAKRNVVRHPLAVVALVPAKLARLFAFDDWTSDDFYARRAPSRAMRAICNVFYWLLCAAALIGAIRAPSRELLAVFASVAVASVVTFGVGRFHAPLVPLLAVLAAGHKCYRWRS